MVKPFHKTKGGSDLQRAVSGAPIVWSDASCANLGAPSATIPLLEQAIRATPARAMPYAKLGNIFLDRFDFARAAQAFEAALQCQPSLTDIRVCLARAYNMLGRHAEALEVFAPCGEIGALPLEAEIRNQRASALAAMNRIAEAEAEYRAVLARNPRHARACSKLCKLLRKSGRAAELLALCKDLAARGVDHAQLLLDLGRAFALCGAMEDAAGLLFDRRRVRCAPLTPPAGFPAIGEFNAEFARELLTNPFPLSDFPQDEEANRGSTRVHHLMNGSRPELVRALLSAIQNEVDTYASAIAQTPDGESDPWIRAMPRRAHLRPWGLIQRLGEFEEWHTHPGGWLSGVYYVAIPSSLSEEGEGKGCIEFGPPSSVAELSAARIETWRYAPKDGTLLMAPSHYHHRTIATGSREHRISFAFDVVSDDRN